MYVSLYEAFLSMRQMLLPLHSAAERTLYDLETHFEKGVRLRLVGRAQYQEQGEGALDALVHSHSEGLRKALGSDPNQRKGGDAMLKLKRREKSTDAAHVGRSQQSTGAVLALHGTRGTVCGAVPAERDGCPVPYGTSASAKQRRCSRRAPPLCSVLRWTRSPRVASSCPKVSAGNWRAFSPEETFPSMR